MSLLLPRRNSCNTTDERRMPLRYFLPLYLAAYFCAAFVWRFAESVAARSASRKPARTSSTMPEASAPMRA